MGLFGKGTQEKQFDQSIADSAEKNDTSVAMQMREAPSVGYDSQVSAMIISVDAKFLPLRFIPMLDEHKMVVLDEKGQPMGRWVTDGQYNYQEPYGEEAVAFVEQEEERRLMNRIGGGINGAYTIGVKYKIPMTNTFNYFVRMRKDQLVNTRSTGKASKLAKSQIVDTSANIMRGMIPNQKKGGLLGFFGL